MNDQPQPLNAKEIVKVFLIEDSDFPGNILHVPHTLSGLRDAMETIFCEDAIIDDYDCDGDHVVTIKHGWIGKAEWDSLEEWSV